MKQFDKASPKCHLSDGISTQQSIKKINKLNVTHLNVRHCARVNTSQLIHVQWKMSQVFGKFFTLNNLAYLHAVVPGLVSLPTGRQ